MSTFTSFNSELVKAVGAANVIDDPKILENYSTDYSRTKGRTPLLVVKPATAEEVSTVVKISNEYAIPVVPRSSAISFYGEGLPNEGGIIVDLSRMNKIRKVDTKNRLVMIEPGVTWEQLQTELEKHDLMALNPLLPHPQKSALTSHLERDRTLIPRQEYKEPLYTVQVIAPTGRMFRTGPSAIPAVKDEEHSPHGPRPMTINWRRVVQGAQGTMGIVTWGVAKVEFLPKIQKLFFIPFQNLDEAVNAAYKILYKVLGHECFILNNVDLALIITALTGKSSEYFETLRDTLPPFTLLLCLAGGPRMPEEKLAYEEETLRELGAEANFEPLPTVADISGLARLILNALRKPWPNDKTYWKFNHKGLSKDIFFLSTMEKVPEFTNLVYEIAEKHKYSTSDIGIYVQPLEMGRGCYVEFGFQLDPDNPEEVEAVNTLWKETCEALLTKGAFFSRPYGPLAPMVYGRCGAYYNALKRLKEVFDPNRILNPGKLGL